MPLPWCKLKILCCINLGFYFYPSLNAREQQMLIRYFNSINAMNSTDWFRVDLWPNVKGKQRPSDISQFWWGSVFPSQSLNNLHLMPPYVGIPGTSLAHASPGPASVILTQWALRLQYLGCEGFVSLLFPHGVRLMTPRLIALPKPRCGGCFPKELPCPRWGKSVMRAISECWL